MNKRIQKLCDKAILDVDGIDNPDTQDMYIPDCFRDRFAELLVLECANYLSKQGEFNSAQNVKNHFGIKE